LTVRRILIIEDDPDIGRLLKHSLERAGGFAATVVDDGESGLALARREPPDLILLDLSLPGLHGFDVCRSLRSDRETAGIPIIMITARVDETDQVSGLELGADDYVTKPFSTRAVVARVRALLRRTASGVAAAESPGDVVVIGVLELDPERRRVRVAGREVSLTRKEFDLLAALMNSPGRVLSRSALLERVWGYDHPGETRTVDVHVRQLRKKLGAPAADYIDTVVGVGYRLREEER
jgi:DNA-binding response OmpR family regulator